MSRVALHKANYGRAPGAARQRRASSRPSTTDSTCRKVPLDRPPLASKTCPLIISVDDHVMEPRDLWQRELPPSLRDRGPAHASASRCGWSSAAATTASCATRPTATGPTCGSSTTSSSRPVCCTARPASSVPTSATSAPTYEDFRPGTYNQKDRLADMDTNHVEAALNYPNIFPRFAGQGFAERADKELALLCLQIYNDWMIDEWCGGDGRGRLIPLTLIPLWDPHLAAAEVRRCAAKGAHAVAFSENPTKLGLPSLYSGKWDPFLAACEETETTISMHIGSSSTMPTTSPDAPLSTSMALSSQNAQGSVVDWVFSGTLARYPDAQGRLGGEPDRLAAVPARAHGSGLEGRRRRPRPARTRRAATPAAGSGAASSTTSTASSPATPSAWSRSCSRPTTRTATAPCRVRARSLTGSAPAPA